MTIPIVPRATWGALPWTKPPIAVAPSVRTHFLTHYDGGTPIARTGYAIPRAIDAEHHARGWNGIGYNYVVSQAGEVFEGRGWGLIGAHCEGFNTASFGVQVAIGGDQVPSDAALHMVRALYDEACTRAGKQLVESWHGAHYPTDCPGGLLIGWVRAGMTDPTPPKEDPVGSSKLTNDDADVVWKRPYAYGAEDTSPLVMLREVFNVVHALQVEVTQLQATVAKLTPKL
jgi:hypothetical protein